MIDAIRNALRAGFELIERPFDRLFGPALNPLAQLGALGFFFFWIVAVSGIYLFIFFDTGIERAYQSVEYITREQWFHAGVMRSFHRYASDLMVVMVVVHLLREFSLDHYRGVRWFSWFTGLPIIWLLYASGITGYWLVWDKLAQFVALVSSELLDWLPIFGEPIARNFVVHRHADQPLLLADGVHACRGAAVPAVHHVGAYPAHLAAEGESAAGARAAVAGGACSRCRSGSRRCRKGRPIWRRCRTGVGLDWFYLPLYPLTEYLGQRHGLGLPRRVLADDRR